MSLQPFPRRVEPASTPVTKTTSNRYLDTLVLALLVAASWIAMHRYQGIWHDGILYAGQAIFRLDPAPFAKDLFFAYGSQDAFTAFPAIYALAIDKLGLPVASAVLLATAHVAWVAAAAFLLRGFLRGEAFWLTLIVVSVLPAGYGSRGVFSYGETFLTARIWAEPPALLAVACILRHYRLAALGCLVFAAAMHPIIAFPAGLFVLFFGVRGRQLWVLVLGTLVLAVLLLAVAVPSFGVLTQSMDPLWLRLSKERSPFVFLDHWQPKEFREPAFLGLLLTTAALATNADSRRLWRSVLGTLGVGMGLALITVYWPAVLLVQLQPWRVLWLVKILAVAAAMVLARDSWSASSFCRILLGALAACAFTLDSTGLACAVPVLALLVAARRLGLEPRLALWLVRVAWGAIAAVIAEKLFWAVPIAFIPLSFTASSSLNPALGDRVAMVFKEAGWFIFPPLLLISWWLLNKRPRSRYWLMSLFAVGLLFLASNWRQTSRQRAAEDALQDYGHAELARIIQARHLTYWIDGQPQLWLILHRGSYASGMQAAGVVFSRQTAIEADRRLARVRRLGLPDSTIDSGSSAAEKSSAVSTPIEGLVHACHDPILDFVVLRQQVLGATPMTTVRLVPSGPPYHLYACAALRVFPDPFPAAP